MGVIHRPFFHVYLKHDVSGTRFCPRPDVEPNELDPIASANLSLRKSIYWDQLTAFHLKTEIGPYPKHNVLNNV
jgi:hypothetical protein